MPVTISGAKTDATRAAYYSTAIDAASNNSADVAPIDVSGQDSIVVAVATDQDGYYVIQFSADGTNYDSSLTRYYRTGRINAPHRFTCTRKWARVVFYNTSASNQTYFRMEISVGIKEPLNVPTDGIIAQDYDATVTRPTIAQDEIVRGLRQGVESWNKFARSSTATASAGEETLWPSTTQFAIMTTGDNYKITYNAATDGAGGGATGATALRFYHIDDNGVPAIDDHTLGSSGTDTTAFSGLGINRIQVISAGSANKNVSAITVADDAGTVGQQAVIPALAGVTQQIIFHVPADHTASASWIYLRANRQSGGNPIIGFKGYLYYRDLAVETEIYADSLDTATDTNIDVEDPVRFRLPELTVFHMTQDTDRDNPVVFARMSLNLYRNADG